VGGRVISKGTIVRVYEAKTCRFVREFRRGVDQASINQIVFSTDATRLAVASDKGTVHVFNLDAENIKIEGIPTLMKSVLPKYFDSSWSFAQLHLKEGKCSIAFAPDQSNALVVVRHDGLYYKYAFDEGRGREAVLVQSKAL
jgi:WD40 repeat protein